MKKQESVCKRMNQGRFRKMLEWIEQADDFEIQKVMQAVESRYAIQHPDWDVIYVAVHKEPKQRAMELEQIIALLRKEKMDSLG